MKLSAWLSRKVLPWYAVRQIPTTTRRTSEMLMRFDPFRELDRLTDEAFAATRSRTSPMPLDAYRDGERFVIAVDLPGVDPSTIDVSVEKNVLTVHAERRSVRTETQEWVVAERRPGTFTRQLFLGDTLDTDAISANYEHGVLTLEIPIAEKAKPRKVEVNVGEGSRPQAVEATSVDTSAA
jgi:HSP20 family protein